MNQNTLEPGAVFGGYTIEGVLGEGGMGTVYRARKEFLPWTVALKVLHPGIAANRELLSRFLREAKMAANLDHPAIVKICDVGEENGSYFIAMEYVDGTDLQALLAKEGPLPSRKALRIARKVAEALAFAHERGIIHRDIKPANIIVTRTGEAKLADLGLARRVDDGGLTMEGQIVGTPIYMSPEQGRGERTDGRSDLYSLGATLYMLLSGKPPFKADTAVALIHKVVNENPQPLRSFVDLPDEVIGLVQRLMAKHPLMRYQTAQEVVGEIDSILMRRCSARGPQGATRVVPSGTFSLAGLVRLGLIGGLLAIPAVLFLLPGETVRSDSPRRGGRTDPASRFPKEGDAAEFPMDGDAEEDESRSPVAEKLVAGSPGRDEPDAPPGPMDTIDGLLRERVEGFRKSLASGSLNDALPYFPPRYHSDEGLRLSLSGFLDDMKSKGASSGSCFIQPKGSDAATAIIIFRSSTQDQPLGITLEWIRADGNWYVQPRLKDPEKGESR